MSAYVFYGFDTAGSLAEETDAAAAARAPRDPPGDHRGVHRRRPDHAVRHDGRRRPERQGAEHVRHAVPAEEHPRRGPRRRVPDLLGDRDHRVLPGRADRGHPDDVGDGPRRPPAVQRRDGEGVAAVEDAGAAGAAHRRPHDRGAADQPGQPAGVLHPDLDRDHPVLHPLPDGHRPDARPAPARRLAAPGARPVLQAGPLGHAGEPGRGALRRRDDGQPDLAARPRSTATTTGTSSGAR